MDPSRTDAKGFLAGRDGLEVMSVSAFYALLGEDDDLAVEILRQYLQYGWGAYHEAVEALNARDGDRARSCFHRLAGASASICAKQVQHFSLSFEEALALNNRSLEELLAVISDFDQAMQSLDRLIRTEIAKNL